MTGGEVDEQGFEAGALRFFLTLAFALTWGVVVLLVAFPDQLEDMFGELSYTNPLFILAVYGAGIAGFITVWRYAGMRGLVRFVRRLTLWRMPTVWWVFLALGVPALFYAGAAITGTITDPFPFSPWHGVIPALAITLFIGPIEEFGWRGVALPLMQRRYTPFWSGLILGAIWGVWHVPAFFLSGTPQSGWSFGPFFIAVIAISIIMTQMFNTSRGSLLVAMLFHFQLNGPAWPDAQPWDTVVFGIAAVIIVLLNRGSMFSRDHAVTDVLEPDEHDPVNLS